MTLPVLFSQVILVLLVGLLVTRVIQLDKQSGRALPKILPGLGFEPQSQPAVPKASGRKRQLPLDDFQETEALTQAQMLAGIQIRDARRQGLKLEPGRCQEPHFLAGSYLYGVARAVTHAKGGTEMHAERIAHYLIGKNLALTAPQSEKCVMRVSRDGAALSCFHRGINSAESWMNRGYTPEANSLFRAVTNQVLV